MGCAASKPSKLHCEIPPTDQKTQPSTASNSRVVQPLLQNSKGDPPSKDGSTNSNCAVNASAAIANGNSSSNNSRDSTGAIKVAVENGIGQPTNMLSPKTADGKKIMTLRSNSFRSNMVKDYSSEIRDNYIINHTKPLGAGASCDVVRIKDRSSGTHYALKTFFMSKDAEKQRRYYQNEIEILKEVDHPNIIRLFQAYEHEGNLHMVLELCSGGNLLRVLNNQPRRRVSEKQAGKFATQILRAMKHMHSLGICHRDIKLENIMLEQPSTHAQIKIIDYGFACRYEKGVRMTDFVGTAYATAPEVFQRSYTEACDMWAIGVVTYALLVGRRPFVGKEVPNVHNSVYVTMVRNILSSTYSWPGSAKNLTPTAIDFVEKLLNVSENTRLTADAALNHPFITENEVDKSVNLTPLIPIIGQMSNYSELKKKAMMTVAFSLSQTQLESLRDIFCTVDTDNSGTLSLKEFSEGIKEVLPVTTDESIVQIFQTINQDKSGEISYLEFLAATMEKHDLTMKSLKQAFALMDIDNNGYLEEADFAVILGETTNAADIKNMLAAADIDGDGRISFAEFLVAMGNASDIIPIKSQNTNVPYLGLRPFDQSRKQSHGSSSSLLHASGRAKMKRGHSDSVIELHDDRTKAKAGNNANGSPRTDASPGKSQQAAYAKGGFGKGSKVKLRGAITSNVAGSSGDWLVSEFDNVQKGGEGDGGESEGFDSHSHSQNDVVRAQEKVEEGNSKGSGAVASLPQQQQQEPLPPVQPQPLQHQHQSGSVGDKENTVDSRRRADTGFAPPVTFAPTVKGSPNVRISRKDIIGGGGGGVEESNEIKTLFRTAAITNDEENQGELLPKKSSRHSAYFTMDVMHSVQNFIMEQPPVEEESGVDESEESDKVAGVAGVAAEMEMLMGETGMDDVKEGKEGEEGES